MKDLSGEGTRGAKLFKRFILLFLFICLILAVFSFGFYVAFNIYDSTPIFGDSISNMLVKENINLLKDKSKRVGLILITEDRLYSFYADGNKLVYPIAGFIGEGGKILEGNLWKWRYARVENDAKS